MTSFAVVVTTVLAVGLLLGADEPRPGTPAAREGDEKVIRELIGRLAEEWNNHDMKAFSARLAEDADVINRFGHWMKGRAEIEKHLIGLHASPYRDKLVDRSSKVEQVRFLTPDVAIAHERANESTGQSVRSYVLQKRDGRWWIQSADITEVRTPPPG
jgi:uncharacterized protein (TIGR02246 family)